MHGLPILLLLVYGLHIVSSSSEFNCTIVTSNYPNTLLSGSCEISDVSPSSFLLDVKVTVPANTQPNMLFSVHSSDLSQVYYESRYAYGNGAQTAMLFEMNWNVLTCYVPSLQNGNGSFVFILEASSANCVNKNISCNSSLLSPVATSYQFVLANETLGQLFSVSQQYVQIPLTGDDQDLFDVTVTFEGAYPSTGAQTVSFTSGDQCFGIADDFETALLPPNVRNTTIQFFSVSPGNLFFEFSQFDPLWKASVTASKHKEDDDSSWKNYDDLFIATLSIGSFILPLILFGGLLYVKVTMDVDKRKRQHEVVMEPLLSNVA